MCREKKRNSIYIFYGIMPLQNFSYANLSPLYNFNPFKNIFLELCTNINHYQTMCREKEPLLHQYFLRKYAPLKLFYENCVRSTTLKTVKDIFMKLGIKLVSNNVQRTRTVTPPTIFVKLCPFEIFLMKILSAL